MHSAMDPDYFPGDTAWTPRDAGWKRKYDTGDTKQPVQAVPIGNAFHAPYR